MFSSNWTHAHTHCRDRQKDPKKKHVITATEKSDRASVLPVCRRASESCVSRAHVRSEPKVAAQPLSPLRPTKRARGNWVYVTAHGAYWPTKRGQWGEKRRTPTLARFHYLRCSREKSLLCTWVERSLSDNPHPSGVKNVTTFHFRTLSLSQLPATNPITIYFFCLVTISINTYVHAI